MALNLAECLDMTAGRCPDKAAVYFEDHELSYAAIAKAARRVANVLHGHGIGRGHRVAIMLGNTPHFPIIYFGILYTGATVVSLNPGLRSREIAFQLADTGATALFAWHECAGEAAKAQALVPACRLLVNVEAAMQPNLEGPGQSFLALVASADNEFAMANTQPEDSAVIIYTSAMSGRPLGADLSHFNLFDNAHIISRYVLQYEPSDTCMGVLPLFHSFGQTCMMNAAFLQQCSLALVPRFEANKLYETITRRKVTLLAMVPTMFHFLNNFKKDEALDLSSVRVAISGGAKLPEALANQFQQRFGMPILEGYGLTETSPVAAFNRSPETNRPGSVGQPIWCTQVQIRQPDGTPAPLGQPGEIHLRGHNVMKGYWNAPELTAKVLDNGGWLDTGDLGYLDTDGYLYITGRKKDVVIRAGMNVYPREIEMLLGEHPAIKEAAVIGVPDAIRGEEVKALLVLEEGHDLTERDLGTWWRDHFAAYKCPKRFEILPELPRDQDGAVQKHLLA